MIQHSISFSFLFSELLESSNMKSTEVQPGDGGRQ